MIRACDCGRPASPWSRSCAECDAESEAPPSFTLPRSTRRKLAQLAELARPPLLRRRRVA